MTVDPETVKLWTDNELHYFLAQSELRMRQAGGLWNEDLERIEKEAEIVRAEDRRRHSIFVNGNFKGGA